MKILLDVLILCECLKLIYKSICAYIHGFSFRYNYVDIFYLSSTNSQANAHICIDCQKLESEFPPRTSSLVPCLHWSLWVILYWFALLFIPKSATFYHPIHPACYSHQYMALQIALFWLIVAYTNHITDISVKGSDKKVIQSSLEICRCVSLNIQNTVWLFQDPLFPTVGKWELLVCVFT